MTRPYVCAVDVGTGSARAGIFDRRGVMLARAQHPVELHRPAQEHAEYDSEEIWRAVCEAVKAVRQLAGVDAAEIAGIGFDATCSLVVRGENGRQVPISDSATGCMDTIAWLDHRALVEADECTASGHPVLDFIGGVMSPEMQTPKLMWLKRRRPEAWAKAYHFFDLADFLTYRASGSTARSQCTLTSKWTYLAHANGWQQDFFAKVGLADMLERGGLPHCTTAVGAPLGPLSDRAARDLSLDTGCIVASGLIDAFAGSLGVIGGYKGETLDRHLALIAGTSSCVMGFTSQAEKIPGVWGPYFGAALPGQWLFEAGQSATGALLDHIIRIHGSGRQADAATHDAIKRRIAELRASGDGDIGKDIHILPDFHGNRSPFADPHARGVLSGLTLDASFDGLCRLYWRASVAIALGVRHILEHLNAYGCRIDTLHITGGHTRNALLMQLYADATGCTVMQTSAEDAVLSGTAMTAAAAAGWYGSLSQTCAAMRRDPDMLLPDPALRGAYDRDYRVFLKMHDHRREIESLTRGDGSQTGY